MTTTFEFDPDDLSVGELVDLTDVAGEDALADLTAGKRNPKMLLALVWILGRRTDPGYTLEAARTVKVIELKFERRAAAKAARRKPAGKKHEDPPTLVVAS